MKARHGGTYFNLFISQARQYSDLYFFLMQVVDQEQLETTEPPAPELTNEEEEEEQLDTTASLAPEVNIHLRIS